jgi:ActR/RegA family two-component response regulator
MLRTLRVEREALAANIAAEREGAVAAFDTERNDHTSSLTSLQSAPDRSEWSKNQQAVQETDLIVSFAVVRCDVHRVMHRKWGLHMSSKILDAGHFF